VDLDRATHEAFDGVEIRLRGGDAIRVPALEVQEAVHYLRLMSRVAEDASAHRQFMDEFPARIGVADVALAELGFSASFEGRPFGVKNLTVRRAAELCRMVESAGDIEGWRAQSDLLEVFAGLVGLELRPWQVFAAARTFQEAFYLYIYGLARDFLYSLSSSPRVQAQAEGVSEDSRSPPVSTT